MEKSFSTYRNVINTSSSDEDSDDLFLDDSETNFRTSLASSTVAFPSNKESEKNASLGKFQQPDIEETDDEDDEPLITYKRTSKKNVVIDSDEDDGEEDADNHTNNDKANSRSEHDLYDLETESEPQSENEEHETESDQSYNPESESDEPEKNQDTSNTPENRTGNNTSQEKDKSMNSTGAVSNSDKENSVRSRKSTGKDKSMNSTGGVSNSDKENSVRSRKSTGKEGFRIQQSILLSSTEDISSTAVVDADVVDVSSGTDDVSIVSVQPPKPSTPKLIQTKITTLIPLKTYGKKSSEFEQPTTAPLTSSNSVGNVNFVAPPGKKFVPKTDYIQQEQKVMVLRQNLHQTRNALNTLNLDTLPDRGAMLKSRLVNISRELAREEQLLSTILIEPKSQPDAAATGEKVYGLSWQELRALSNQVQPAGMGGKKAMETYHTQKTLTMDRLKSLHSSLESKPAADVMEDDPKMLKVELMPHQKHALAFLLWREGQKPAGGILADDMGLGKTLTMISLILKTKELSENEESASGSEESSNDENKDDNEWKNKRKREYYHGGTLVVCPASLINQWENEITRHCKRDCLSVYLYHGANRELKSRRLAKHDVVITTYNLVGIDIEKSGGIFGVRWRRIILDEAHVVRNSKAKASVGVCALKGKKRWCLTGTPVQNKELDLYALLKFLKCSPFDDISIWKKWIDNKSAGGQDRLNTVIQSIMLRRTKQQLQENGSMTSLPDKKTELIQVKLTKDEMNIYQKILVFSKTLFAQFLHQRAEKNSDLVYAADNRQQKFLNANQNPEYEKIQQRLLKMHGTGEVKAHQILVLLLRLRQTCCHVALIKSMIENVENAAETDGIEDTEGNDIDLLEQLEKLDINDEEEDTADVSNTQSEDGRTSLNAAASKLLNPMNPIFNPSKASSKVKMVIDTLKQAAIAKGDKAIVVSQWTSMLKIIEEHLVEEGIKCETLDGKVPVNKRMGLVDRFNRQSSDLQVLLLSLTAGGVGLNLVGANHLLLIDLHWNPQLEAQAQDRIYRFGQKKDVCVYKFVTMDTIEERIKALQEMKLGMANSLLTGTKQTGGNKLSMEDLKMLFNMT